jgi:hypothetical protein
VEDRIHPDAQLAAGCELHQHPSSSAGGSSLYGRGDLGVQTLNGYCNSSMWTDNNGQAGLRIRGQSPERQAGTPCAKEAVSLVMVPVRPRYQPQGCPLGRQDAHVAHGPVGGAQLGEGLVNGGACRHPGSRVEAPPLPSVVRRLPSEAIEGFGTIACCLADTTAPEALGGCWPPLRRRRSPGQFTSPSANRPAACCHSLHG